MLTSLIYTIIFAVSFILVLSALVFFHELGHYSVARFFKVAVDRFSIGFGKPLAKWRARSGTEWIIGTIPLGGYVRFMGDAGAASNPDQSQLDQIRANIETTQGIEAVETCFHFKPLWQRALIVLAGPMANFLLAIIIFAGLAIVYGSQEVRSVVMDVAPDSAAQEAGVLAGDAFLTMDGKDVSLSTDLIGYVALRSGQKIKTTLERGNNVITLPITPKRTDRRDFIGGTNAIGTIGVRIGGEDAVIRKTYGPLNAIGYGSNQVVETIAMTGTYIKRIFQGKEDGKALGGPVRIATMTGKTAVDVAKLELSFWERFQNILVRLLSLGAALSIGLGVANLMPIPVLDGGHLLYYGYEAVAGRPLSERKQEFGFRVGFAFLMTMLVILTWNDIGYVRSFFS